MSKIDVCKFNIRNNEKKNLLTILQFFFKKNSDQLNEVQSFSAYRLHLVSHGSGTLKLPSKEIKIKQGDLFLIFPETMHSFPVCKDLEYYCISFIDLNAKKLLERTGLSTEKFHIGGLNALIPHWESSFFNTHPQNIDLIAESVLLYTYGYISKIKNDEKKTPTLKLLLELKEMADLNFKDQDLNLKAFCIERGYNITYISLAFKKFTGITFWTYVNVLRMNHAEFLMRSGETSIKKISAECGFRTSKYFAHAFKKAFGYSPKEYMNNLKK